MKDKNKTFKTFVFKMHGRASLLIMISFLFFNFQFLIAQNVGMGVSDPDAKLEIKGEGTANGKALKITDNSDNKRLHLQDNGYFEIETATGTTTYTSEYPPAHNSTYVKATSYYGATYEPWDGTDPSKPLTGSWASANNSWITPNGTYTNQKFNIDLGSAKTITNIYLENGHASGTSITVGIKNFIVYGSNTAGDFSNTTYSDILPGMTEIGSYQATQHRPTDDSDPQYFKISSPGSYRYYILRIADNWAGSTYMVIRHIELQSSTTTSGNTLVADSGRVGIGRLPLSNSLEVNGSASKTTAGSWIANSDRRIKTDILNIENSIETIKSLHPVKFKYSKEWMQKNPSIKDKYYYNFIAQEYQQVFPESVQGSGEYLNGDNKEILQIDTYNAQIVTIKAVQELIKENEMLKESIEELKKEILLLQKK